MNDFFDLDCFLLKPELSEEVSDKRVRTWLEYKIDVLKDNKGRKVKDPDASEDARDFYQTIWEKFLEKSGLSLRPDAKRFSKNPDHYVQGNWMCSVATTFRNGLILFVEGNDEWELELNTLRKKYHLKRRPNDGVGGPNTYGEILLDDMKSDEQKFREFWGDEVVQNFVRSAYTPANLIIVPDGFNGARYNPTKDYWDLTLKKYYHYKEPLTAGGCDVATPFRKLLKKNREEGDSLCLSPWIDEQGNPILLPHSPNDDKDNKDNWRDLMAEMTRRIKCRREQMAQYIAQLQNE